MTTTINMTLKTFLALSLLVGGGCAIETDLESTTQEANSNKVLLPKTGTGQNREVMSSFNPLAITLTDSAGLPLENVTVTFTSPVVGASATFKFNGEVETDSEGNAELRPYANSITGTYTVWAHVDGAAPMPFVLTNTAAGPALVTKVLGTNQARLMGMPFPYPLTIEVQDNYGNAVEGAPVQFVAPSTGATTQMTEGGVSVTDDAGRASVFAVAGSMPGTYTVLAKVTGAPSVSFTLSNTETAGTLPEMAHGDIAAPTTGTSIAP